MTKQISKTGWKPVALDANVLNSGIEGLVGIEECLDYSILNRSPKRKVSKQKAAEKSIKRQKKLDKKSKTQSSLNEKVKDDLLKPSKEGCTEGLVLEDVEEADSFNREKLEAWTEYGLPDSILRAIGELGFIQPTEIQRLTLPAAVLGRRDILGAAETGSGKTLAFGLPILTGILKVKEIDAKSVQEIDSDASDFEDDENEIGCVRSISNVESNNPLKPLYALILTPTRELAVQVKNHLTALAKHTGINIAVVMGGMAEVKQQRILGKGPEIVVATPGRLWELIQSGNPHLSQVNNIRFLAIDETDRMLERGHFQELHDLLERINLDEEKRKLRQNFVFSATLTLVHELPKYLAHKKKISSSKKIKELTPSQKLQKIVDMLGITDPKVVDVTQGTGTSGTLTECRITCGIEEKDYYVYYFLQKHPGRTLIFCNTIGCVKRLTTLLGLLNCSPLPLHASMQQRQRLKNLERFRDNEQGILIATDVAARGLDIPSVEHVLHYQTPRTSESYVHRSGRTARASKEGITVLLMEPGELNNYLKLCRTLGKNEDMPTFPVHENFLNAVKQRVNLARELDKLELQVRKANSEAGWFNKAAEEMDIIIDEEAMKYDCKDASKAKKVATIKRKELDRLLMKQIFPKGLSGKYPLVNNNLDLPLPGSYEKNEKAIDVMKNALENMKKDKKKKVRLYKPKKNQQVKSEAVITLNKKHNRINKKTKRSKR